MPFSSRVWLTVTVIALAGLGFAYSHGRDTASAAQESAAKRAGAVDAARLSAADKDGANWMTYGRTYDEKRFSPLTHITDKNVSQLKPAWQFVLNTTRGQEETPLVVDGVMYVVTPYSIVYAIDARTGKEIWHYDPGVPKDWSVNSCCGPINRGVAVWNGKVYTGTLNGHLIALDAGTGKVVWDTFTFPSETEYTATGAPESQYTTDGEPRVVKGMVMFGTSGGDKGVRGFISAYDAETGKMIWRFYTVPGDPAKGFENKAMEMASKTWEGDVGGGGAVWESITYDSDLDLLYFGTGNATPGPKRDTGDRLFGESIVAIRPETGEYVWHYQETPNDAWDYDSIPQITLADIKIGDRVRKVLLHAPKNGFFYVLDRATGELLSAAPLFKSINWASAIDMKTGRPVEIPGARNRIQPDGKVFRAMPGTIGGHNWQAMSYSPLTGLTYVTMLEAPAERTLTPDIEKELSANPAWASEPSWQQDDEVIAKEMPHFHGHMAAWDPVTQHEVWGVDDKGIWLGGTLSTAGNLVFMGTAEGELLAYTADTGKELWSKQVQTAIIGPPITYEVGGEQYVAVAVGWGASYGLTQGPMGAYNHIPNNLPRVVAFKLNGKFTIPPVAVPAKPPLNPPPDTTSAEQIDSGRAAFTARCGRCHGSWAISPGDVPDLRYSASVYSPELLKAVVRDGVFRGRGMPMFGPEVTDQNLENIRAYIIHQANEQVARNKAQQH